MAAANLHYLWMNTLYQHSNIGEVNIFLFSKSEPMTYIRVLVDQYSLVVTVLGSVGGSAVVWYIFFDILLIYEYQIAVLYPFVS